MVPSTRSTTNQHNRNNPTEDLIAGQLSAIVVRLDAILAPLKEDIVAIKTQMLGDDSYDEKADEDQKNMVADKRDTTPLWMDVAALKIAMFGKPTSSQEPQPASSTPFTLSDVGKTHHPKTGFQTLVPPSCHEQPPAPLQRPKPNRALVPNLSIALKAKNTKLAFDEKWSEDDQRIKGGPKDLRKEKLEWIRSNDQNVASSSLGTPMKFTDQAIKVKEQAHASGVIMDVAATYQSPPHYVYGVSNSLRVKDHRPYYNNKENLHNLGSTFLNAGNKDVQADLKHRDLACQFYPCST